MAANYLCMILAEWEGIDMETFSMVFNSKSAKAMGKSICITCWGNVTTFEKELLQTAFPSVWYLGNNFWSKGTNLQLLSMFKRPWNIQEIHPTMFRLILCIFDFNCHVKVEGLCNIIPYTWLLTTFFLVLVDGKAHLHLGLASTSNSSLHVSLLVFLDFSYTYY
jgi:hypothetical protein